MFTHELFPWQVNVRKSTMKGYGEEVRLGCLFMVDLAGSERAKKTQVSTVDF